MRTLKKNKQRLYYALKSGKVPVYERDENGDIKTITIDGKDIPLETGDYAMGYSSPVKFMANIALSGGESTNAEFGVDVSQYDAILITDLGSIPITETSLIWYKSEPTYKDSAKTIVEPDSADFAVVAIKPSLNQFKAILRRLVR